ncbi:MAG: hypothetical protein KatS3mg100_537 [Candidatus Parcubacteria bacterium]|nr:MAG: hypothetical protein KatS3mg100_537 [Candidatus Parcubacteria bacterium]
MPRKWYWIHRVAPLVYKNMNYKNCAIYTRVSTDNQTEKEFSSCESQEEKSEHLSKAKTTGKFSRFILMPDIQDNP